MTGHALFPLAVLAIFFFEHFHQSLYTFQQRFIAVLDSVNLVILIDVKNRGGLCYIRPLVAQTGAIQVFVSTILEFDGYII